jgi:ribosomal protein S18 acetylase RimI-like enzyme
VSVVVRRLTLEDVDACMGIRREALEQEPEAFSASVEDDRGLSPTLVREALASTSQATFGAFAPGLVGVVGISRSRRVKAAHKAHLWGLYVSPAHRGGGIGRCLVEAALDFARQLEGVTHVHLSVSESGGPAIALYESLGFTSRGVESDALWVNSRFVATRYMVLLV